ncbi:uncharacterized protein [Venturia canescens]|uniref:uncharacterized protein n=1 Tax=Venturia canescens TaxID=32260 RepID=UPI001C9D0C74|nr:uncharacterized protein LOC122415376 [Venturia canescens]
MRVTERLARSRLTSRLRINASGSRSHRTNTRSFSVCIEPKRINFQKNSYPLSVAIKTTERITDARKYSWVYRDKHRRNRRNGNTMASKVIRLTSLLAVVGLATLVKSMPTLEASTEIPTFDKIPDELLPSSRQKVSPEVDVLIFGSPMMINKRSVMGAHEKANLEAIPKESNERIVSEEETQDDLETAAGTNVLRPLFVYRQQLAYRERARKAGRRSAPNI